MHDTVTCVVESGRVDESSGVFKGGPNRAWALSNIQSARPLRPLNLNVRLSVIIFVVRLPILTTHGYS